MVENWPSPDPGPGEIKVGVEVGAVNFPDVLLVADTYQLKVPVPFVPGSEFAGVVVGLGDGVDDVAVGDRVTGTGLVGAFAEEVVVPATSIVSIPDHLGSDVAAAAGVTYRTAHHVLRSVARVAAGDTVVVLGAGGGVGSAAVQLATELGAAVTAVASSREKLEVAAACGAVHGIDRRGTDVRRALKELHPDGVDVVIDPVGGQLSEPALRSLRWGGRFVTVGFASGEIPRIPLNLVLLKGVHVLGFQFIDFATHAPDELARNEAELRDLLASGRVRPHVGARFPLDRTERGAPARRRRPRGGQGPDRHRRGWSMTGIRRVVQWATGNIGTRSLRAVIEHPALELVGVYVHSPAKAGTDAGDLCGHGPVGVVATDDIDDVVALGADCVLYMPAVCDHDELCTLLAAGSNVVTTRGEFHRPASLDDAVRGRIEAACAEGQTSIHSTGSSPGFITEALPMVLTSLARRLDLLAIDEFADLSRRPSPELLFDLMGFGQPPRPFDDARAAHLRGSFGPSLQTLAEALGTPLDRIEADGAFAVTTRDVDIAAGRLPAGTIGAQRVAVSGWRNERELLRFRANWYCTTDLDPAWELHSTGWHVSVQGDTPMEVGIEFAVPIERMAETAPGYTAHRAVNSIEVVCAAPPGIRMTPELPRVIATLD